MIDAISMLSEDHNRADRLFKTNRLMGPHEPAMQETLILCQVLRVHAALEEELVYPVVGKSDPEMTERALSEHEQAKEIIVLLEGMDGSDMAALKDGVDHLHTAISQHVAWEEDALFAKLSALGADEGERIGREMYARRQELMEEYPMANAMSPDTPSLDARPKI